MTASREMRSNASSRSVRRRGCEGLTVLLILLRLCGSSAAEVTPSGFEITTITLGPKDGAAPAEPLPGPSTNAAGDVAFTVSEHGTDIAYLRHSIGVTTRVLATGDGLAGSTVTRLVVMPTSLDAYRQVLFYARLADGRAGLFRASWPPSPRAVWPKWGYRDQPTAFQLAGDTFAPGVQVFFGDVQASLVTVISQRELTGIVPAGAAKGQVDVSVARPGGGKRTLTGAFEFRDPPRAGCQGLWPDHRPPAANAALPVPYSGAIVAALLFRRRSRQPRSRG